MIHVFIRGRLGNQLFQYAFIRNLQINNPGTKVVYHFDEVYSGGDASNGWVNSLRWFNTVGIKEENLSVSFSFIQRVLLRLYWGKYPHNGSLTKKNQYQRRWISILSRFGLFYLDLGFFSFPKKIKYETVVLGNFECEKYFNEIKDILVEEIQPTYPIKKKNLTLYNLIKSNNSVCISIRRGDFVENKLFKKVHNVCTQEYYMKAIERIKSKIENPVFFFFSDDIDWVKNNIKIDYPCYYEDGNDPVWEKLRLMYSCKHFIISNSSFSWWAQYLGRNKEKIVVAPSKWYNDPFESSLFQSNWEIVNI